MQKTQNPLETVAGAFEQRMEKRRRMLNATGVELPENSAIRDMLDAFPQSVINCYSCENDDLCLTWLDENETAPTPPDFCPNRDLILAILERDD